MELAALRESLRRLAPRALVRLEPAEAPRGDGVATGFAGLDQALEASGLSAGKVSEIAGAPSSGKTALVLRMAAARTAANELVAFVDGRGQMYPPAAAALGVDLARLLVVTPARKPGVRSANDLIRAAEIICRSRAFPFVVIDLPPGVAVHRQAAARLRSSAHQSGAVLVVLATRGGAIGDAAARLVLQPRRDVMLPNRSRHVTIRINKGGRGGAVTRTELTLDVARIDDSPPQPVTPAVERIPPGFEATPP